MNYHLVQSCKLLFLFPSQLLILKTSSVPFLRQMNAFSLFCSQLSAWFHLTRRSKSYYVRFGFESWLVGAIRSVDLWVWSYLSGGIVIFNFSFERNFFQIDSNIIIFSTFNLECHVSNICSWDVCSLDCRWTTHHNNSSKLLYLRFLVWCSSISHLIPPNFGIEDPVLDDKDRWGDFDLGLLVLLTTWILEPFLLTAAVTGDFRSLKWRWPWNFRKKKSYFGDESLVLVGLKVFFSAERWLWRWPNIFLASPLFIIVDLFRGGGVTRPPIRLDKDGLSNLVLLTTPNREPNFADTIIWIWKKIIRIEYKNKCL